MTTTLHVGDCVEVMAAMPPASVDAIVTDPPYGIGFMGKAWDGAGDGRSWAALGDAAGPDHTTTREPMSANRRFQGWVECWAAECLRVLKPGGHLLAFGGTRTYHRLAAGIEDAGFEIRDCLAWLFGSGFPKSRNLDGDWHGWGTALKPAHEPIVLARKPLAGTVAGNVVEHGTGALNVDGCRIQARPLIESRAEESKNAFGDGLNGSAAAGTTDQGRWPANVVLDPEAGELLDEQSGQLKSGANPTRRGADKFRNTYGDFKGQEECEARRGDDVGGASRFFYCAKTSSAERNAGLDHLPATRRTDDGYGSIQTPKLDRATPRENWTPREVRNVHPTVKPIALMRWLIRLVTPPDGVVLDPFTGSGTTGAAAALEGVSFVGVEREDEYAAIAEARIEFWRKFEGADEADVLAAEGKAAKVRNAGQLGLLD